MASARPSTPASWALRGDPVAQHDVDGEQHGVGRGEGDARADRTTRSHVGEQVDAGDGEHEGRDVARACGRRRRPGRSPAGTRSRRRCPAAVGRSRGRSRLFIDGEHGAPARAAAAGCRRSSRGQVRQGRRQGAKISAAEAIRSQATPRASIRANSSTANAGPEVVEDRADHEVQRAAGRVRRDGSGVRGLSGHCLMIDAVEADSPGPIEGEAALMLMTRHQGP